MQTQSVFKAGNSFVVSIPKSIVKELGIKNGQKVEVKRLADTDEIVIKTQEIRKHPRSKIQIEFKKWLKNFLKEDGELLDELATR